MEEEEEENDDDNDDVGDSPSSFVIPDFRHFPMLKESSFCGAKVGLSLDGSTASKKAIASKADAVDALEEEEEVEEEEVDALEEEEEEEEVEEEERETFRVTR